MQNCSRTSSSYKPTAGLPGDLSKSPLASGAIVVHSGRSARGASIERGVYALSCGAVSLVEFTVNHIAFIARFSSLSSVGSIHFQLIPIRISSPLHNRDLDTHLEIMWEIKHVGDFFFLSPHPSHLFFSFVIAAAVL